MGRVMIRCPKTGKPAFTGMDMPKETVESDDITMSGNSFQCDRCGQMHTWDMKDAWVAD